jgi:GH15 family glucan-1,4-alpha-glucosidase
VVIYLEQHGDWCDAYWQMTLRMASYTTEHWREMDSGIWELPEDAHYVSSKVMSWVCLERASRVAELTGHTDEAGVWRVTMDVIHAEVMERGWSEHLGAFRARYDTDTLDASALLVPLQGFLPGDHPKVVATIAAIEQTLTIDGLVHRFLSDSGSEGPTLRPGDFEGAFVPATCWLATAHALAGAPDRAEAILDRVDLCAGALGLLPEEIDARSGAFLGNIPLVFSHGEYLRAVLELSKARRC